MGKEIENQLECRPELLKMLTEVEARLAVNRPVFRVLDSDIASDEQVKAVSVKAEAVIEGGDCYFDFSANGIVISNGIYKKGSMAIGGIVTLKDFPLVLVIDFFGDGLSLKLQIDEVGVGYEERVRRYKTKERPYFRGAELVSFENLTLDKNGLVEDYDRKGTNQWLEAKRGQGATRLIRGLEPIITVIREELYACLKRFGLKNIEAVK